MSNIYAAYLADKLRLKLSACLPFWTFGFPLYAMLLLKLSKKNKKLNKFLEVSFKL